MRSGVTNLLLLSCACWAIILWFYAPALPGRRYVKLGESSDNHHTKDIIGGIVTASDISKMRMQDIIEPETEAEPDETENDEPETDETEPDETEKGETEPDETEPDETEKVETEPDESENDETEPDETENETEPYKNNADRLFKSIATQDTSTQHPATQLPATQLPATQHPATQHPATQHPATQHPATQDSTFMRQFTSCGGQRVIALTFDDGPLTDGRTESILDDLQRLDLKATFFLWVGEKEDSEKCSLVRRMVAEGHVVQGHTTTHPRISKMKTAEFERQLDAFDAWLSQCLGDEDRPVFHSQFRPPFGDLSVEARKILEDRRKTIVTWNIGTEDWRASSSLETVFNKIVTTMKRLRSAIILLHDTFYQKTEGILDLIVEKFKDYRFVTTIECQMLNTKHSKQ